MKSIIHNNKERNQFVQKILEKDIKVAHRAEFTKIQRPRTISQNSYLWLLLTHVEQETGNDKYDLYCWMLSRYPTCKEIIYNEKTYLIEITSSAFDVKQMIKFISNIKRFFRQEGFEMPDANTEQMWRMYNYYQEKGLL